MKGYSRSKEDFREKMIKKFFSSYFIKMPEENLQENYAWDYGDEYAFWEEVDFDIQEITHDIRPHSNQALNTETSSACTMIGALNQIIRLFWIDLNRDESNKLWIEVVTFCEQFWYKIWYWWDTPTAINAVCKFWNQIWAERFGTEKVFYCRRYWDDEKPQEALEKWHLVWFTMALNFGEDKYKWLVWRDKYPWAWGHRLNRQSTKTTKPTWWASEPTADCGVYDNYEGYTNQYLIRDRKKYIWKWMYGRAYMIMPQSRMKKSVEEEKKLMAERKAINYTLWALSCSYESVPAEFQEKFAQLAKELREYYKEARQIENEPKKKWAIAITDALSYLYKFADSEDQKTYAEIAANMREKYKFS